ncbi:MAG: hypothetical protein R3D27_06685 [Hyphomicrobiaceae bacterium]
MRPQKINGRPQHEAISARDGFVDAVAGHAAAAAVSRRGMGVGLLSGALVAAAPAIAVHRDGSGVPASPAAHGYRVTQHVRRYYELAGW